MRLLDLLAKPFRRAPRETAADRAAWLESAVRGMAAQAHHAQLAQLRTASRSFEAGETPAWVASWATTAAGINDGDEIAPRHHHRLSQPVHACPSRPAWR